MVRPRTGWPEEQRRYGLGVHLPGEQLTWTVVSNRTDGAWPVLRVLREVLTG